MNRLTHRRAIRSITDFSLLHLVSISSDVRRLLFGLMWSHKVALLVTVAVSILAAFFEGSTLGVFALALQVLAGSAETSFSDTFGRLGTYFDSLQHTWSQRHLFLFLIGLAVFFQLLRSLLQFSSKAVAAYLLAYITGDTRRLMLRHLMRMSFRQFNRHKLGDLMKCTNLDHSLGLMARGAATLICEVFIALSYVAVLLWLSWKMTVSAVLFLSAVSFLLLRVVRRIRDESQKQLAAGIQLNADTADFLRGMMLIRCFSKEKEALETMDRSLNESVAANRRGYIFETTIVPLVETTTILIISVFLLFSLRFLGDSLKTYLPSLTIFLFTLYRLVPRIGTINTNMAQVSRAAPNADRIVSLLCTELDRQPDEGEPMRAGILEAVEFHDVSLSYDPGEKPAVQNLNFTLPRGSMTALVGASGAGKTTVVNLLLRLYDATEGRILIDGKDLYAYSARTWRERIGIVTQDTFLFHGSIYENIVFAKPDASREDVIEAAKAAYALDFVQELSDGFDTIVGDRGVRLSGGQRQRIAIARALIHKPEILVFDEATSALDSQSEQQIQKAIANLRSKLTMLVIAHRLSTVSMSDSILVLENGRIVERGKHEELLAREGSYAKYWELQSVTRQQTNVEQSNSLPSTQNPVVQGLSNSEYSVP
ncbi:MAG: ABC transporter ATP-binding protein [bacterium]